ncbi:MAG: discoidin domain-containing protein [Candidatus Eremiobacteraeota bacterium]|nr:discoidin domain-containing protein [Candidatus Eremiobacteraeota bacterium]
MIALLVATLAGALLGVHVDAFPAHKLNTIRPLQAIGVGIDSDPRGKIPTLYSPARTREMLSAGLGVVSYRLYTELSIQDWHWNDAGSFSDERGKQGYWTSSERPAAQPIVDSYAYVLPHRGSTRDQGDDDDYSRIDDGDPATYWKSDPYLAPAFTHEPESAHPQWAVIDLNFPQAVDGMRIHWVHPYAVRYRVEYWTGGDAITAQASGTWHRFPNADQRMQPADLAPSLASSPLIRLAPTAVKTRFVRIWMTQSSHTCDTHGALDNRNCVGYAMEDLALGGIDGQGALHDIVRHNRCGGNPLRTRGCSHHQTAIFVSSIDPWHRATDRAAGDQDQPGLDFVSRNPITRGVAMMYAVPLFYSTPANARAEIRYLKARGYPMRNVELGEEVDGQYALPEDYAALYLQFARSIHKESPALQLGGPIFQGVNNDIKVWPDASGDDSWLHRFLKYLRAHDALRELNFMSFEHYPFKGCDQGEVLRMDLLREPSLVRQVIAAWRADGLPKSIPMYITESNFANDGGPVPKQLEGALWMADWIGTSLSEGVAGLNYYQYEAEPLGHKRECDKYGNYGMFITDQNFNILARAGQYYGAQMLTKYWLLPGDREHGIFPVRTTDTRAHPGVSAYAARRPDGMWSVMLVNKDREAHAVTIDFATPDGTRRFKGGVRRTSFGSEQFHWNGNAAMEIPNPDHGPVSTDVADARVITLPPLSLTVVRGNLR